MKLKSLPFAFSVVKYSQADGVFENVRSLPFFFFARTSEEISLVCETERVPAGYSTREDGWRALAVQGPLDFSLVGILADISAALAREKISIFAVSTYDTDYILVKNECFDTACVALTRAGYEVA